MVVVGLGDIPSSCSCLPGPTAPQEMQMEQLLNANSVYEGLLEMGQFIGEEVQLGKELKGQEKKRSRGRLKQDIIYSFFF